MSYYMIVSSDTSLDYYPRNKPYSFKIKLPSVYTFSGLWKIALLDIVLKEDRMNGSNQLYVCSNICSDTFVNGEHYQLLRKVIPSTFGKWSQEFGLVQYQPINKTEITDIEFYIKDEKNVAASFLNEPVTLTLHFRAYPFIY